VGHFFHQEKILIGHRRLSPKKRHELLILRAELSSLAIQDFEDAIGSLL